MGLSPVKALAVPAPLHPNAPPTSKPLKISPLVIQRLEKAQAANGHCRKVCCASAGRFAPAPGPALAEGTTVAASLLDDASSAAMPTAPPTGAAKPIRVATARHDALPCNVPLKDFSMIEATDPLHAALQAPRPLVFTNGVFDLLHAGHVECLERARCHGRSLVVGINSDASARRLDKGPGRPLNNQRDRARVVAALSAVFAVVLFDEDTPVELLRRLRPEVYVKGGDYAVSDLVEARVVAAWGGQTVIVPRVPQLSTSGIVERIAALHAARESA